MFRNKNPRFRLEAMRPTLFLMGLLMATATVLCAFEWRVPLADENFGEAYFTEPLPLEDELIPIALVENKKPIPPPPPLKKEIIDRFVLTNEPLKVEPEPTFIQEEEPRIMEIAPVPEKVEEEKVYSFSEVLPSFPGGDSLLFDYLAGEIRYPPHARESGIQGRVYISFVVEKDGSIADVKVERGVSEDIDREALRAVREMPDWNPGSNNGVPVRVRYYLPVFFRLK